METKVANSFIAETYFTYCVYSNVMYKQFLKYPSDRDGIKITSHIVDEVEIPNENVFINTKYYQIYKKDNYYIQIQKNLNNEIIGRVDYYLDHAELYMTKDGISKKEYILTEYASVFYVLKKQEAIFIHSSSVAYEDKGILFIASSGTGKSTHARLWKEYLNIEQINDDKNIIINKDGDLYIYGNPWSGKSLIDSNIKVKLTNLVFLERGEVPVVNELSKKEGFIKLLPHMTNSSFMFNKEKWDRMTDLLLNMNLCVLKCNISYESVDVLKDYLGG